MGQVNSRFRKFSVLVIALVALHGALSGTYYFYALSALPPTELKPQEAADTAAVVLFHDFGSLSGIDSETAARLEHAKALFDAGLVEEIITVGGGREHRSVAGAEQMKKLLLGSGVPEHAVSAEASSYDTRTNLEYLATTLRGTDIRRLVLVSSSLHLFRISLIAGPSLGVAIEFSPHSSQAGSVFATFVQIQREWIAIIASTLLSKERYDAILRYLRKEKEFI